MASPARPASVYGPFGSAPDLAIFSTPTTTRRADPARAGATAAGSTHTRPGDLLRGTDLIPRAPPAGVHRSTDLLRVPLLQFT